MSLRAPALRGLAALLLSTALAAPLWAQGRTEIRATSGVSFEGPGEDVQRFIDFSFLQLNNAGQIAFQGTATSIIGPSPFAGLWLDDTLLVRLGLSIPGLTASPAMIDALRLNNLGDVAYSGTVVPNFSLPADQTRAIWVNNERVARTGADNPIPGYSNVTELDLLDFADSGRVFARATDNTDTVRAIALDPATGASFSFTAVDEGVVNVTGTANGTFTPLMSSLDTGALDAQGRMALTLQGTLNVPGQSPVTGRAILRTQAGAFNNGELIAMEGRPVNSVAGASLRIINDVVGMDAGGRVAYRGVLERGPGGVGSGNDVGIFLDNLLLARTGRVAAGTEGAVFSALNPHAVAATGTVLATGGLELDVGDATVANRSGIWLFGPNGDSLLVARAGQTLDGVVISNLLGSGPGPDLNDYGQVLFRAPSPGLQRLAVFTPELRWIPETNGAWDNAGNWTVGLPPALVHDVFIDPSTSLTVVGPSDTATVKSLEIGGGDGTATLLLNGGTLTALEGVTLTGNGRLTGVGTLAAEVLNRGQVTGNAVRIAGTLDNEGVLRGRLGAETLIAAETILNRAGGLIDVRAGEGLTLEGPVESLGETRVIGGRLDSRGGFANAGTLNARAATLDFAGGLDNTGRVQLSLGITDIFGAVDNAAEGQIIQSGGGSVTFWDDMKNNGEIRVSEGGAAILFGDLFGAGSFTGPGTVFLEGGTFSPGSSPGIMSFAGDFDMSAAGGSSIFIGGPERGTQYSGADVGGTLTLGGILTVELGDGFLPGDGSVFDLFNAASILGEFTGLFLPDLGGAEWEVRRTDTRFSLAVLGEPGIGVIPLPAGGWLLLSAFGALVLLRRRRPG